MFGDGSIYGDHPPPEYPHLPGHAVVSSVWQRLRKRNLTLKSTLLSHVVQRMHMAEVKTAHLYHR